MAGMTERYEAGGVDGLRATTRGIFGGRTNDGNGGGTKPTRTKKWLKRFCEKASFAKRGM